MRIFGEPDQWPEQDCIGWTDEFDAELVLHAYAEGVFPMPLSPDEMGWWAPVERGILPLESVRITRSLRQSAKRYRVSVDAAFQQVLAACGDPARPDGWIDDRIQEAYTELFDAGIVHSVECWDADGNLVGGLYGVSLAGLFAGESMFHTARDASKVALLGLLDVLDDGRPRLLDVQWTTPHLASLGALDVTREEYLDLLDEVRAVPLPDWTAWRARGRWHAGDA